MNCGTEDERSDFFAFNDYSWCSPSTYETAGWNTKVKKFSDYSVPIFLAEYGCNTNKRDFGEVEALYSEKMTGVYSGGLVYEFSQEGNNYGLVKISDGDKPKKLDDFDALKKAFKKTPSPKGDGGYKKDGKASKCPKKSSDWNVDDEKLPAIPSPALKYMEDDGPGDGPGFEGGSQNAGTGSSGTATPGSGSVSGVPTDDSEAEKEDPKPSESENAALGLRAPEFSMISLLPLVVVGLSTLFGASLIMV